MYHFIIGPNFQSPKSESLSKKVKKKCILHYCVMTHLMQPKCECWCWGYDSEI